MSLGKRLFSEGEAPLGDYGFGIVTYSGNSSTQSITGLGFQPDLVWIKERGSNPENHNWYDSSRGVRNFIGSNSTAANVFGSTSRLTSFDSDGFTLGADNEINDNGSTYVAWCWKANGGNTISNADGTNTSTVQASTGFSMVQGTASGGYPTANSFGHGLGVTPAMIFVKETSGIAGWSAWHKSYTNTAQNYLNLNTNSPIASSQYVWGNSAPTSSVFSITDGWTVNVGATFIAYCFAEVSGYSAFGSYAGNGSSQSINIGFQPDLVILRKYDDNQDWMIWDSVRDGNPKSLRLEANNTDAEVSGTTNINFISTGFEFTSSYYNDSGKNSIYMAFKIT